MAVAKAILRPRLTREFKRIRRIARQTPMSISNPALRPAYEGVLIPHVRADSGEGSAHTAKGRRIAFVGTRRKHKGLESLRKAVSRTQDHGFQLLVTDHPPVDPWPWETWLGPTDFETGQNLVRNSDLVVIPSDATAFSEGQLPAKLVDAMMFGRPVIASDLGAIRWALGDAGSFIDPGSTEQLVARLGEMTDLNTRKRLGRLARNRALEVFSIEANLGPFALALASSRPASRGWLNA